MDGDQLANALSAQADARPTVWPSHSEKSHRLGKGAVVAKKRNGQFPAHKLREISACVFGFDMYYWYISNNRRPS
jgi:hypothetical protein